MTSSNYQKELQDRDNTIIRLNNIGLGLTTIAQILGCHPSTITHRLKKLGIEAMDTRRAFMEDVITQLTEDQQQWLLETLDAEQVTIKEYITKLIAQKFQGTQHDKQLPD